MRVLTVQQPWAWAIIHGGKDVENRTQLWKYRGPLAIHAGARLSERGCMLVPELLDITRPDLLLTEYVDAELTYGAIIGVVQLVDVHRAEIIEHPWDDDVARAVCCDSPWAEVSYRQADGRTRYNVVHLVLEDPQPIDPIPCKGRLGLWTPSEDIAVRLAP